MRSAARLRDRRLLDAQIAALHSQVDTAEAVAAGGRNGGSSEFARGALDALEWLTCSGPAPLTGALAGRPVALEMIVAELATAEDLLYGRPSPRRDYARGVQHALMWAQFATAAPPTPQPSAQTSLSTPGSGVRR